MLDNFEYNIAKTKAYGHILISTEDWIDTNILTKINIKGRLLPTKITKVLKINSAPAYRPLLIEGGDIVALSHIATRVGLLKPFKLPNDPKEYANVHLSQVLGYFKDGIVNIENFVPMYDKVVMKKIKVSASQFIDISDDNMSVGEVIATGDGGFDEEWKRLPMTVEVGSHVLVRDNVSTSLNIGSDTYFVVDDKYIMGSFKDNNYSLDDLILKDNDVNIFEEYEEDTIEGSFLFKPVFDKEETEISQTHQENMFKSVRSNVFNEGSVYIISRFDTEYIKFKGKTYHVARQEKVLAKKDKGEEINGKLSN